jgi:hypothetical protein
MTDEKKDKAPKLIDLFNKGPQPMVVTIDGKRQPFDPGTIISVDEATAKSLLDYKHIVEVGKMTKPQSTKLEADYQAALTKIDELTEQLAKAKAELDKALAENSKGGKK